MARQYDKNNNKYVHSQKMWNIQRYSPQPIDDDAIWCDYDELSSYALSSPISYVGQIITYTLSNETETGISSYQISKEDGTLKRLLNEDDFLKVKEYIKDISAESISCNFNHIYNSQEEKLCGILNPLDNSPTIDECVLRAYDYKKFCGLTGQYLSSFDPNTLSCLDELALITQEIYLKVTTKGIEKLENLETIKNILDDLLLSSNLTLSSKTLEFRLQHLKESDEIILNRLQIANQKIDSLTAQVGVLQNTIIILSNLVNELSSTFFNTTVIIK